MLTDHLRTARKSYHSRKTSWPCFSRVHSSRRRSTRRRIAEFDQGGVITVVTTAGSSKRPLTRTFVPASAVEVGFELRGLGCWLVRPRPERESLILVSDASSSPSCWPVRPRPQWFVTQHVTSRRGNPAAIAWGTALGFPVSPSASSRHPCPDRAARGERGISRRPIDPKPPRWTCEPGAGSL
jgi:hypothetical protein